MSIREDRVTTASTATLRGQGYHPTGDGREAVSAGPGELQRRWHTTTLRAWSIKAVTRRPCG